MRKFQLLILLVILFTQSGFAMSGNMEKATLGGGCFWCTEAVYLQMKGVVTVEPGYSGGHDKNPTYEEVCEGTTGHAEVVMITFDPVVVTFSDILDVFFQIHDPTTLNRQGADVGTQYRSVIFYHSEEQKTAASAAIRKLNESRIYPRAVVTEVSPATIFYSAEKYHHNYYNRNQSKPYCRMVVSPKVEKFQKLFKEFTK